jgi:chromosome partitioning protein
MVTKRTSVRTPQGPIVAIYPELPPIQESGHATSLQAITDIAQRASSILADVREHMLAPHPRKNPPIYSGAQVATLCGIDRARLSYLAGKEEIPGGTVPGIRKSRQFSLAEARICVQKLAGIPARPEGASGRVIAVGNFKGGVAKTTTTMTLAQGLSLRGRSVLIIDMDPQASLTTLTGLLSDTEVSEDDTVLPLVYGEQASLEYAVQDTYWDGIDLIPASTALFSAEFFLPLKQSRNKDFEFWNVLNHGLEPLRDHYDVILIDTPPALSYLTINAFMAADGLIVPTPPNALDFASSTQFWALFADLAKSMAAQVEGLNKEFDFLHVLLTKVDNQQVAAGVVRDWIMRTYGALVLPVEIPLTTVTQSAAAEFGTVYDITKYEGSMQTYQRAREAYDRLAEVIDQKLVSLWRSDVQEEKRHVA